MIRVPSEFKPLMDQLSSATLHRATAIRLIFFFMAATLVDRKSNRFSGASHGPCLFLISMLVTFYDTMPTNRRHLRTQFWLSKETVDFSDMIINVHNHYWINRVFEQSPEGAFVQ